FALARERGGLEEIEHELVASIDEYPARPMLRCMLSSLYVDLRREEPARHVFEQLAADDFTAIPLTNEWLFTLGFLAEVAAFLGALDRAAALYRRLHPYASRNASTADYIATGSVSRHLGVLAAALSRWRDAERHFEDAVAMNAGIGARPSLAHTQQDYARMLVARDRPGDAERAKHLSEEAVRTYRELGMEAALAKAAPLALRSR